MRISDWSSDVCSSDLVQIRFENESKADLSIVLMADTANTGTMEPVYTLYTAAPEGLFAVRGFDTLETEFQAFVRDRWNNKSDTLSRVRSEERRVGKECCSKCSYRWGAYI